MGFDVNNTDRDFREGTGFYQWSGAALMQNNLCNPSEWGNLELAGPPSRAWIYALLIGALGAGAVIILRKRQRKKAEQQAAFYEGKVKPGNEAVQKTLDYIVAHYEEENLDLNAAANYVCLNPKYLSTLFKKETGTSFVQYISNFRVKKAEEFLKDSSDNITQVAYKVGFGSIANFNKAFKKVTKTSPKIFRKTP
jgi:AraC-like DNA-binding protein